MTGRGEVEVVVRFDEDLGEEDRERLFAEVGDVMVQEPRGAGSRGPRVPGESSMSREEDASPRSAYTSWLAMSTTAPTAGYQR